MMATSSPPATYGLLCFAKGGVGWAGQVNGSPALPEIHLNIWEREPSKSSHPRDSTLDIGLMIDVLDQTQSIELVFPTKVPLAGVEDLSAAVSATSAVPVIFNESWAVNSIGTQGTDSVVHDPANSQMTPFAIVSIARAMSEETHVGHAALSISVPALIAKGHAVARALGQPIGRVYIRFRILQVGRSFYCVGAGDHKDDWWMPSWQRTEDIDFRLNVRRGAPAGLESAIGRFVEFSKVHLFLMRSRDKDIIFQDKLFNSSRSLEDESFWAQYSLVNHHTAETLEASRKRVKNSLGYHWKAKGEKAPIKEFATLARFKVMEFGIGKFLIIALLLGAAGNALWDGAKLAYFALARPTAETSAALQEDAVSSIGSTQMPTVPASQASARKGTK